MISSTSNSKVKRLAALGQKAKLRREEQVFIVEGIRMFREAPAGWVKEVYVSESFLNRCVNQCENKADMELKNRLETFQYEVLTDEVFKKASDTQTPQGVMCVLAMPQYVLSGSIDSWVYAMRNGKNAPLLVLLEDLQDPGNLGTILRAGEAAGVSGVIMTRQTADIFNPKVIRATMGSIYRVPFFIVDGLADTIDLLKQRGITVYAAHLENSMDYDEPDYTQPAAFLIGNEGNGLRRETADRASQYIKIPMEGQVESLNAAAAAAILMYEASRQRRR
ncbi:MAG: RNA methyltransferase [Lachnospiraceae bacterium]|nr:RNA methyltransferase [Lachnospiraceae bacterium]